MTKSDNSSHPTVTVVTAVFNLIKNKRLEYFKQCVTSVLNQTYSHIDHLVIDGASTDGTREWLEDYAPHGHFRLVSEADTGIYDAMNKGIHLAKGKYIAFLNSDDYWHGVNGIRDSVEALERTGAAFSYAPVNYVDENNKTLSTDWGRIGQFANQVPFNHQTMFTRKDILEKYNGFNDKLYKSAADYDFFLKLILNGEAPVYVENNFTSFRMGGFSNASENQAISYAEVNNIRIKYFGEENLDILNENRLNSRLYQYCLNRVHPLIAYDMLRTYTKQENDVYLLESPQVDSAIYLAAEYSLKRQYKHYKAMSLFTFGKRKRKYKNKISVLKELIKYCKARRGA